ncbi:50S ribosomal protein L17 [Mycoplasma sp. SG1]|uniref:50S ribosomal protein L17 n=1 Tax=Mycoplasma sp. SG1 TaxID=2810348 RepID=UPI0020251AD2|nr:50S ribosomal protein L17 [Mycoplasma sp. SG1]URM52917.1 50S ribosomal protein L17 [Mycoplasma sp. SG1]
MSYIYNNNNFDKLDNKLKNLTSQLIKHNKIIVTLAVAKRVQQEVEHLITTAKKNSLHSLRTVKKDIFNQKLDPKIDKIKDKKDTVLAKLTTQLSKKYQNKSGGYTKILKLYKRAGDNATMVLLQLV